LACMLQGIIICGSRGLWCTFAGFTMRAAVRKHKRIAPGVSADLRIVMRAEGTLVRERAFREHAISAIASR